MSEDKVWNACGYLRLSHEDGDKEESNSISSQRDMIRDYLSHHPELRECGMKVDDGFTGSNFERPAFKEMMADVKAGKIDCIVVKDLSRFGRNYLEAGNYIERIFPYLGVRFIAINDNYDSLRGNVESDELVIPFKNLINEAYCRDTSVKVRSQLEIKRKRGDFVGPFAAFGYRKDPNNHNRLLVDDYAANVVRDIFKWKLEGISAGDIADRLNSIGIPTPMDYKNSLGMRYNTAFRVKQESVWIPRMVLRILKNPIYIGTLVQGCVTTPSYKVKRRINKPREEWDIIENNHEPIIERFDFDIVQRVLALDTRTSVSGEAVEVFSGMIYCGECGASMTRKTVPSGKKKYVYYICSAHKNEKTCSSHSIRDTLLKDVVLKLVQQHIQDVIDLSDLIKMTDSALLQKANVKKLQERIARKKEEIQRCQKLLQSLYESMTDGIIDQQEYQELKKTYIRRRTEAEEQVDAFQREIDQEIVCADSQGWIEQFRRHQGITALDRAIVVSLIERIMVYREHRVEIVFRWSDEYRQTLELLLLAQQLRSGQEAD